MTLIWLLMTPLFAWADRSVGGAGSRSFVFTVILIIAVWFSANYPAAAMACIAWVAYRSMAWWGTTTPRTVQEALMSYAHNSVPALAMGFMLTGGRATDQQELFMISYAIVATLLAVLYGQIVDWMSAHGKSEDGQVNRWIEILRGAYYGFCLSFPYLMAR